MLNRRKTTEFIRYAITAIAALAAVSCNNSSNPEPAPDPEPTPAVTEVQMDKFHDGLYFGDFWKEGYADYYFILSKGDIGQTSSDGVMPELAPMNPGDYVLYVDIWGAIAADHTDAVIPEGTYTAHNGRANGTFNTGLTFATVNKEKVGDKFRIENILFETGEISVKHIDGGYDIKVDITGNDGNNYIFRYQGPVKLRDQSSEGEEISNNHIKSSLDLTIKRTTLQKYSESDDYDNYVIRCFDTDNITNDGLYPNEPGHKIQIDLYTAHGADIAGTYKVGKRMSYSPGTFYPGVWVGSQALGTFCMQTDQAFNVKFCTIGAGEVTITRNGKDSYTIKCDFTDDDGYSIKSTWTGDIEEYKNIVAPQTTLTSDVTVKPTECAAAYYYGDYYGNGTANYGIVLSESAKTVVSIDFAAASGNAMNLPEGTYNVSSSSEAWTVCPGNIGYTSADPTCYVRYDDYGYPEAKAPVCGGWMKISRSGLTYTIEFEFQDDYNLVDKTLTPHKISGSWTGTVSSIYDYTKQ